MTDSRTAAGTEAEREADLQGERGRRQEAWAEPGWQQEISAQPAPPVPGRVNLLGLTRTELEAFCVTLGSKPFRGRQLMSWLYKRGCDRFEQMSDLALDFRGQLAERAEIG